METMKAARLHEVGAPFRIDDVPIPEPTGADVLIEVEACGVVPNLKNVITYLPKWFPHLPLPPFPAIFGLDAAGTVAKLGPDAAGFKIGQRVYVNPVRTCGVCVHCRRGQPVRCPAYTFAGYFGFSPASRPVQDRYPWGGLAEYMVAPVNSLVTLPDRLSFEDASRFGYLGTSYAALRRGGVNISTTVLINGATGTLGVGAVLLALALGAPRILAVARNHELLARVKALAPDRIETFSTLDGSTREWSGRMTGGAGVDVVIEALAPGAPLEASVEALYSVGRGGNVVTIGGMQDKVPVDPIWLMACEVGYLGSSWFTTSQGQDMADMVGSGVLDLSSFDHRRFALDEIEEALAEAQHRQTGGFESITICP